MAISVVYILKLAGTLLQASYCHIHLTYCGDDGME